MNHGRIAPRRRTVAAPAAAYSAWSRRRILYTAAGVFFLEIVLVLVLADRPQNRLQDVEPRTTLTLAADEDSLRRLVELPDWTDPTLLALPGSNGFSGGAWFNFATLEYRPSEWTEPPQWLEPDPQRLTRSFQTFMGSNTRRPLLIAERRNTRTVAYDLDLPSESVTTSSTVRVEGELAGWSLLNQWILPSQPHSDVLSNTVVQVVVDAAGHVVAATLVPENESGRAEIDQYALQLAKAARFSPSLDSAALRQPAKRLTWGRIIFRWHTVPLPATTNNPAGSL